VCPAWMPARAVPRWAIANGYKRGLTIERAKSMGNEPAHCLWVCPQQREIEGHNISDCVGEDKSDCRIGWMMDDAP